MSAFYDIWIGAVKPRYTRLDNNSWEAEEAFTGSYFSLPPATNESFIHRRSDTGFSMIIIGSFYDSTTTTEAFERCKNHILYNTAFDDPAGHYIIFIKDLDDEKYYVYTNRLGTYHAYWSGINGYNVISTYYMGLAKQAPDKILDWQGLTGFMTLGFFPNDATYLQDIKILNPASCYCFDSTLKLQKHSRYHTWQYNPIVRTQQEWCARLNVVLQQAISRALNDKRVVVPISGGLDSRTLAGVATDNNNNAHASLWAYSYGFGEQSVETKIAAQIAGALEIDFTKYPVKNYLFDKVDVIADSVELFQYIDGTRQAGMLEVLQEKGDVVLAGHWGDVWMDDMKMEGFVNLKEAIKKKVIKKGSDRLLTDVCKPHFAGYATCLDDYFTEQDNKYRYIEDLEFRMKAYKTDQWSFRWTVPGLRMYQAAIMPVLPFYDKRIVELFSTIPAGMVKDRELQVAYLKMYHSSLAKITWQEYGNDLYNYKKANNRNIVYRAVKKAGRLVAGKQITRNWELFYLNDHGRNNLEEILLNTPAFNSIVSQVTVKQILDDFYKTPNAANGYTISMLHTLAQFARLIL